MLSSFPVCILVGTILGFLSGLGIGGGSLLILWLTMVLGTEPEIARSINLLFFLPAAILSSLIRLRRHSLPWRTVLPAILSGAVTAASVTFLRRYLDTSVLRKAFGILLLAVGFREVFYKQRHREP